MVGLVGPTTASGTEGFNGAGNVSVSGSVSNTDPGSPVWLAGGYTVLSGPSFGTLTINQNPANGEGGYTWSFAFDSDDPALDSLDRGSSLDVTFNVRVYDVSWSGTADSSFQSGIRVVDTHQVTITIFGENEVCFTRGTEIATPSGPRLIEHLKVGDLVTTRDNGSRAIKWMGYSEISQARRRGNETLEPVLIEKDALEPGVPARDLAVSQQHRVLLSGQMADQSTGPRSMLVGAKHLCDGARVRPCGDRYETLEYWHLMLDEHEVVFANGCPVESFYFGPMSSEILDAGQLEELKEVFPDLNVGEQELRHPVMKARDARNLKRFEKNLKPQVFEATLRG